MVKVYGLVVRLDKQQSIQRAQVAKSLSDQLKEPFLILEQSYMEQIIDSTSDDEQLREHLYHRLRVVKDLQVILTQIIADGQLARADIIHLAKVDSGEIKEFF